MALTQIDPAEGFQRMVNMLAIPCAILSVEKGPDETAGMIRIVRANQEYRDAMGDKYYDDMPYDELVSKNLQFESSCFRCAFLRQQVHTYVQVRSSNMWIDQQYVPLHSDRDDVGYLQFLLEISTDRDRDRMAAVTMHTAAAVLRSAITLLGTNDLKERVTSVLKDILQLSDAFAVRLMLIDHENRRAQHYADVMAVELPEDAVPPEDSLDRNMLSYELICSWEKLLANDRTLVVTTEPEMDALEARSGEWVHALRAAGVYDFLLFPLRHELEIIGYLYVCNFDRAKVRELIELARLMSFFLGTEIYNEVLLKRLDEMSRTDALTGLFNRNAMLRRTNEIIQSGSALPFGVINLDLNGLKTVNDLQGHDAGDRLLIRAARLLKEYFLSGDLFRTGGDEFIVISGGIPQAAFARKVDRLREIVARGNDVSFAIGAFWSDGTTDVNTALRLADEMMYADKKAYYAAHPDQRR